MHKLFAALLPGALATALAGAGCGHAPPAPPPAERQRAAAGSIDALRGSRFDEAARLAVETLRGDPKNPQARAVLAVSRYLAASQRLWGGLRELDAPDWPRLKALLVDAEAELALVDADLSVAAADPGFALELCVACWQVDWNRNGRPDQGDARLLQIEIDARGDELPEGDPRRTPTFRFDVADVHWARAMIAFQRAALDLGAAWRWTDVAAAVFARTGAFTIHLDDRARVAAARERIRAGLAEAERCRAAVLAETDDDREWLPNPRQLSHAMPLPVDDRLFTTWAEITRDLRRLVDGDDTIDVAEAAQLGDHRWERPPTGSVDVGRLFSDPTDITLDLEAMDSAADDPVRALESVFGAAYRPGPAASPTPLLRHARRIRDEVDRGEESMDRKLRYLLWLN